MYPRIVALLVVLGLAACADQKAPQTDAQSSGDSLSVIRPKIGKLPKDVMALTNLTGKVIGTEPLCPEGVTCVVGGTRVKLKFFLGGCADQLGPVVTRFERDPKDRFSKGKLIVSAVNVAREISTRMDCANIPSAFKTVDLINFYGEPAVEFTRSGPQKIEMEKFEDADAVSPIIDGEVLSKTYENGPDVGATDFTIVRIKLPLSGCLDFAEAKSSHVEHHGDGQATIFVSAVNVHDRKSKAALCIAAPTDTMEVTVPGKYDDLDVKFLNNGTF